MIPTHKPPAANHSPKWLESFSVHTVICSHFWGKITQWVNISFHSWSHFGRKHCSPECQSESLIFVVMSCSFIHKPTRLEWHNNHNGLSWFGSPTDKQKDSASPLETDIQAAHQSLVAAPANYLHVCTSDLCDAWTTLSPSVCVFPFSTFSNRMCVCVCACNRRRKALTAHSGKYLGWFPSECLGVPMECPPPPPPTVSLLPFLAVALSPSREGRREGRESGKSGGAHKFDPCFVATKTDI